jgi:hypothetical protein
MHKCEHCGDEFNDLAWHYHQQNSDCYNLLTEEVMQESKDQTQKKDAGKPRWELLPFECLEGMVKVLTFGAQKYSDGGWKTLMINEEGYQRVVGSTRRHQLAMERDGVLALDLNSEGKTDEDHSGLPHIDHLMCNILFIKYYQLHLQKEADKRPTHDDMFDALFYNLSRLGEGVILVDPTEMYKDLGNSPWTQKKQL